MSSPKPPGPSVSADTDDRSNRMSIEITPNPPNPTPGLPIPPIPAPRQHQSPYTVATLLQDYHSHLSALPHLPQSEVIVLLTPVVIPISHDPNDVGDPFEPLGRTLSSRHAKIRHVPYTNRNGITSTHVGFIKRAAVLIMVISDLNLLAGRPPREEEDTSEPEERSEEFLQIRFAAIARAAFANYGDRERPRERPFILVVTCPLSEATRRILETSFGTVICSQGYSKPALESTATLIFSGSGTYASTVRGGNVEGRTDQGPGPGGPPPQQSLTVQVTRPPERIQSPAVMPQPISTPAPRIQTPHTESNIRPRPHYDWKPEQWDEDQDLIAVHNLWNETMDPRFKISSATHLASLLNRTGYARHYVIRSPKTSNSDSEQILGFAATYLTYIDQEGEKLLGSLAILLVSPSSRNKGIGICLHNYAINQLKDTMGVRRLQLGSLWPRILFGPLCGPHTSYRDALTAEKEMEGEELVIRWFRKRGWTIADTPPGRPSRRIPPGQGSPVHDLILLFSSWTPLILPQPNPTSRRNSSSPKTKRQKLPSSIPDKLVAEKAERIKLMKSQITFRPCTQADMASILSLVDEAADIEGDNLGWYDQYSRLSNEIYVKDIIVATTSSSSLLNTASRKGVKGSGKTLLGDGVERTRLVGCALTYTPDGGNPVAADLPWAGMGGSDVGGVCCVCISATVDGESLMLGLLDACVVSLREQGMKKLYLDTVRNHLDWFEELGFVEWARYRDVWRDVTPTSESEDGENGEDHDMEM